MTDSNVVSFSRLFPGLSRLRGHGRAGLRADLVAGLTVGAMLIPQAANTRALTRLERAGLAEPTGALRVFPTINGAVKAFRERDTA